MTSPARNGTTPTSAHRTTDRPGAAGPLVRCATAASGIATSRPEEIDAAASHCPRPTSAVTSSGCGHPLSVKLESHFQGARGHASTRQYSSAPRERHFVLILR